MASATLSPPGNASRHMPLPGQAGPLRYANAEHLPSYPSPGLKAGDAAASAAASLGWANAPSPATTPRMSSFQEPQIVSGSQDARLAAGWAQRHQKQQPPPPSAWVSTAANLAFNARSTTPSPATEHSALSRQNSMRAAKGAMAGLRPRAQSSPQTTSEAAPSYVGTDALSAATLAHRPSFRASPLSAGDAGSVPYTTMDRQMFTSNPPVKPEIDERNRADVLHASALAMAKTMYNQQQKIIEHTAQANTRSPPSSPNLNDATTTTVVEDPQRPPIFTTTLQEAAYRLAQERLTKLQEEHDRQRAGNLQDYYGASLPPPPSPSRKLSTALRGKFTRRRASSDGDLMHKKEDRLRSEQIRKQMTLLNSTLTRVDEEKRARDREALLAAAQRNVKARLREMDEKVQADTGRVPHGVQEDWGRKAMVAAQARVDAAAGEGGERLIWEGEVYGEGEVERIAARKVQPLLDEINEKAERERERVEGERLEEERRREKVEVERMREREVREIHKKLKDQQMDEKKRLAEIKHEEKKLLKEEAKAAKAEQQHAAEEEKQKDTTTIDKATTEPSPQSSPISTHHHSPTTRRTRALSIPFPKRHPRHKGKEPTTTQPSTSPDAHPSTSPTRKVRDWLRSRLPRPRAKSTTTTPTTLPLAEQNVLTDASNNNRKSFIGGIALTRLKNNNSSSTDIKGKDKEAAVVVDPAVADSSMREVALAGRSFSPVAAMTQTREERPVSQASIPASVAGSIPFSVSSVSSMSSSSGGGVDVGAGMRGGGSSEDFVEARCEPEIPGAGSQSGSGRLGLENGGGGLAPSPPRRRQPLAGRVSPFRESRFSEILE